MNTGSTSSPTGCLFGECWKTRRAPVFVDNAEGVTALDRIPGQRIRLAVSAADETLRTEIEEE